jgi:hypothetical protein
MFGFYLGVFLLIGIFSFSFYGWFYKPSWIQANIWTNEKQLKNYLSKHFVNEKVAIEMVYRHSQAVYIPLVSMQSALTMLIIVVFMKFMGYMNNFELLSTFINVLYGFGFLIALFPYIRKNKFIELVDDAKIKRLIETQKPVTPAISMNNQHSLSKSYYFLVVLSFVVTCAFALQRENMVLIIPMVIITLISLITLYFIDNKPINYMFAKDRDKWTKLSVKQKTRTAVGVVLNNMVFLILTLVLFLYI